MITDLGGDESAGDVALQADGKILVAGTHVVRYTKDGQRDPSWKVIPGSSRAVAVQADGRIVVLSWGGSIARYHSDGSFDVTFPATGFDYHDVAAQPDGKVVAAGWTNMGATEWDDFAVVRYNADGSLDGGFGDGGKVTTGFDRSTEKAMAVGVHTDGTIVAVGHTSPIRTTDTDVGVASYTSAGRLSWKAATPISSAPEFAQDFGYAVAFQPDGKVVVGGTSFTGAIQHDYALVRYDKGGALDTTFGAGGIVVTDVSGTGEDEEAFGVAVQPDGKILAVGEGPGFAVVRYRADGALDGSFDTDGMFFDTFGYRAVAGEVAVQPDGKAVVVGTRFVRDSPNNRSDIVLARFLAGPEIDFDWRLEPRFGGDADGDRLLDYFPPDGKLPVSPPDFEVTLDSTPGSPDCDPEAVTHVWGVEDERFDSGPNCELTIRLPEGTYDVSLRVTKRNGASEFGTKEVVVQDWLIVSIGDSVASGEGNPDLLGPQWHNRPRQPQWQNRACHRSALAGPAQAAKLIEDRDDRTSVTFVHLACSGASIGIGGGLLGPYGGVESGGALFPPQVEEMVRLTEGREIDGLLISIGANDLGFAKIVEACATPGRVPCYDSEAGSIFTANESRLSFEFARLGKRLSSVSSVVAGDIVLSEYFDPTTDDDGSYCGRSGLLAGMTENEWRWASRTVLWSLNDHVRQAAVWEGWRYVSGIAIGFQRHGYCARDNWVVTATESQQVQGNMYGALHPNLRGHQWYGWRIAGVLHQNFWPEDDFEKPRPPKK